MGYHRCVWYAQRTLPLLNDNKEKNHVHFCEHFWKKWGLPQHKVFLINYDEKYLFDWVCRVKVKKCEFLGLDKTHTYIYHKVRIYKVTVVALKNFSFDGNMDNVGVVVKLIIYRVQGAWIVKKTVRKSWRDREGHIKYNGEIMRKKVGAYMVDCTVTGADYGTSDEPKFSLKYMFEEQIFPKIAVLVAPGEESKAICLYFKAKT